MPLAVLLGRGDPRLVDVGRPGPKLRASDVAVIGLRHIDPNERDLLKTSGMGLFTMRDIDELGISAVLRQALDGLAHLPRLHVSLDMDAMDPNEAPGVGTAVRGGLTYREAQLLMEILADTGKLGSMDVVEVNPVLDIENRTGRMAVDLVSSALGMAIL
jgi:arginase